MAATLDVRRLLRRYSLFTFVRPLFIVASILQFDKNGLVCAGQIRECFNGTESDPLGEVTLSCPTNHGIMIVDALFGKNVFGACIIRNEDCFEKTLIFSSCNDLNECTQKFKTYSTKCGYITVLILSYECILFTSEVVSSTAAQNLVPSSVAVNGDQGNGKRGYPTSQLDSEDKDDSTNDDIGLIIGCAVASVITIIVLIIAIIMVIRRLQSMHSRPKERNIENQGESHSSSCIDSACACICNKLICFSNSNVPKKSCEVTDSKTSATATATTTGPVTFNAQRMSPVGQESFEIAGCSGDILSTTATNNNPSLQHSSDPNQTSACNINKTESSYGVENDTRGNNAVKSHTNVKSNSHRNPETEMKNSCEKSAPYSFDTANSSPENNQNNCVEAASFSNSMLKSCNLDKFKNMDDKAMLPKNKPIRSNKTPHSQRTAQNGETSTKKSFPKFDAVAIPKACTEEGSPC